MAHQAARWSHVLFYDKKANDGPGNVLLVYLDDRVRVLRHSRLDGSYGAEDLWAADAMLLSGQDDMRVWWEDGRYARTGSPSNLLSDGVRQRPNCLRIVPARLQALRKSMNKQSWSNLTWFQVPFYIMIPVSSTLVCRVRIPDLPPRDTY